MPKRPKLSDDEFVRRYNEIGGTALAKELGYNERGITRRVKRLREKGEVLESPVSTAGYRPPNVPQRFHINMKTGCGIVASDLHLWPGERTLMLRALIWACKEFKPKFLVLNGDVLDFPSISRFPRIGWETLPTVAQEIEHAQDVVNEIELALPRGCAKTWPLGNHDKRFETIIANKAPELARVTGVHLKDHFPTWEPCWSTVINPEAGTFACLIKHRFRGGVHDVWNNMLKSGCHCVTGHTHSPQVRALTYFGERTIWGMNTGMVAEPMAKAFVDYTEDNPKDWRSGFGILRWQEGTMMQPQLVLKWDETRVQIGADVVTP